MTTRCLRRTRVALAGLMLAACLGAAPPVESPFAGTWKITLPNQKFEVTPWILQFGSSGISARLVSGLETFARTQVAEPHVEGERFSVVLVSGLTRFRLTVQAPPAGKVEDALFGTIQTGTSIVPIWLTRTTIRELVAGNASRGAAGFEELQDARKLTNSGDRLEAIQGVVDKYPGKPINFLALQAILGELIRTKAEEEKFRQPVEAYRKLARRHGSDMTVGANLDLARFLMAYPGSQKLAIASAREAAKVFQPGHTVAMRINVQLTLAACLNAAGMQTEMKTVVKELDRLGKLYIAEVSGPDASLEATGQIATLFLSSPAADVADTGLEYARKAEKLLTPKMPPEIRLGVYKLLVRALLSRKKNEEARKLQSTLGPIETELDRAYLKSYLPFEVDKFTSRKGKSTRVSLVELFTASNLPPAMAAAMAYDAARKTYPAKDVVFLQYHQSFPQADVLANPDSEARKEFYKSDLEGIPAIFVDGKLTPSLGGAKHRGKTSYDLLRDQIDKALEVPAGAGLKLDVTRKGDAITAKASLTGLAKPGRHLRLRFALVEEQVRDQGSSGVRLHHQIVRGFLGGVEGMPLESKEEEKTATMDLGELRKSLVKYLDEIAKKAGGEWVDRPLDLTSLKVIAFVQDEDGKQVLQAAQADVPAK